MYYFFLLHFSTRLRKKKYMCDVYMYYNLYYVAFLCIVVFSKHSNDNDNDNGKQRQKREKM